MQKIIKYAIGAVIGIALIMGSISIEPLDEHKAKRSDDAFDAKSYASKLLKEEILEIESITITDFLEQLEKDSNALCENSGKKLGVSDTYSFLVKGDVVLLESTEELILAKSTDSDKKLAIATDFIFGNAIRDASGLVDIGDFQNTMDFNTISVEINNLIREQIVPSLKNNTKVTDTITLFGAVQINTKNAALSALPRIIPIAVTKK